MNKIFLISSFCIFHIFSLYAMKQQESLIARKFDYLTHLMKNVEKTKRLETAPRTEENSIELKRLEDERNKNDIAVVEYSEKRRFFRQEIPWNLFGLCWKKKVNTIECLFGGWDLFSDFCISTNTKSTIIGEKPGDENRPLKDLVEESAKGWNVYFRSEIVYCLKTKILFSTTVVLGLASLWYYIKPFTYQSNI